LKFEVTVMSCGYLGKLLMVDLSRRTIDIEELDESILRSFIGGYGLGAHLLFHRQKAGVDPLSEQAVLGFLTGPLTGTPALGGSRYTVVGKSPLTGGWGDANSGGDFGPYLKFAGYDALFFTSISETPVFLMIDNGQVEIRDAAHLWGKDCYETEEILMNTFGKDVRVACIGPAGEKLSLIAAIMNDHGRAAGRSGLGAVMGSKKLKAVAVRGKAKIPLFDEEKTAALRKTYLRQLTGTIDWMKDHGTAYVAASSAHNGDAPVKNWGGIGFHDFPDIEEFAAEKITGRKVRRYGCYKCPIGCGAHMQEGKGEYQYREGSHRPEYETLTMFGSNCLNSNVESIIKMNDQCNCYGIDTISAGAVMAFAIECYENKLITSKNTDGIEMTWGNHRAMVAMMEKVAKREGFGDVLADGVKIAAEKIGQGANEFAMHVQGQELGGHDPKHDYHWGIGYLIDPTPGRHTQNAEVFRPMTQLIKRDRATDIDVGQEYKAATMLYHTVNCSGLCAFVYSNFPRPEIFAEFMAAITGWDCDLDELAFTGERILNIRQVFGAREGQNQARSTVPGRVLGHPPFEKGPHAGVNIDEQVWYRQCFAVTGWDFETGRPTREKLTELGMTGVADGLWRE
jgi:aldehyde:ferredoxin oxidoreductase